MINLPFRPENRKACRDGKKVATSRTTRFGEPGDFFLVGDAYFELVAVIWIELGMVASDYYSQEGFETPEAFINEWCSIHPRLRFKPKYHVWFHVFKRRY
jgi:hypothetical protein